MNFQNTVEFARILDQEDPLKDFRDRFFIPKHRGHDCIYFTGNSLGLQPKTVSEYIQQELDDWAAMGVEGHLRAKNPWLPYHEIFPRQLSAMTGAKEKEIVVMNQLTVNLHLLLVSFYQPSQARRKIICEARAFPSDQYALESQVRMHGFNPDDVIIEIKPREGEHTLRTEDIVTTIETEKESLALVMFGGVNYYTGQFFDIAAITNAAHKAGAMAGFDMAHAIGNVELKLHEWDVDFACWCSYKYLNSGPGGVAGVFVHERLATDTSIKRFAGWWGHDKETRFEMEKGFKPIPTAEGWQLSNAPVLSMAAHKASLDIFEEAGMENLHLKRKRLSSYLHFVLEDINRNAKQKIIEVITPGNENERGCQVSMLMLKNGKQIFRTLMEAGVIADWREPNVIRIAPVPLYNSFEDIWRFGEIIKKLLG